MLRLGRYQLPQQRDRAMLCSFAPGSSSQLDVGEDMSHWREAEIIPEPVAGWPVYADFECNRCGGRLLLERVDLIILLDEDDNRREDRRLGYCCVNCRFRPSVQLSMRPWTRPGWR